MGGPHPDLWTLPLSPLLNGACRVRRCPWSKETSSEWGTGSWKVGNGPVHIVRFLPHCLALLSWHHFTTISTPRGTNGRRPGFPPERSLTSSILRISVGRSFPRPEWEFFFFLGIPTCLSQSISPFLERGHNFSLEVLFLPFDLRHVFFFGFVGNFFVTHGGSFEPLSECLFGNLRARCPDGSHGDDQGTFFLPPEGERDPPSPFSSCSMRVFFFLQRGEFPSLEIAPSPWRRLCPNSPLCLAPRAASLRTSRGGVPSLTTLRGRP